MPDEQKPLYEYECLRVVRNARGPQDYDLEIRDQEDWIPFYLGRGALERLSQINDIGELALRLDQINRDLLPTTKRNQRTVHDLRNAIQRARIAELKQEKDFYFDKWQEEKK